MRERVAADDRLVRLHRIAGQPRDEPRRPRQLDRADHERDVVEQWTEIIHHESGVVTLERMASTALVLPPTNVYLTHFFGDWVKEMLSPITEQITPGTKVLDSKIGVRADQFQNPSFVLSLDGVPQENSGRMLAGSLAWSGSFQMAFDDNNEGAGEHRVLRAHG